MGYTAREGVISHAPREFFFFFHHLVLIVVWPGALAEKTTVSLGYWDMPVIEALLRVRALLTPHQPTFRW